MRLKGTKNRLKSIQNIDPEYEHYLEFWINGSDISKFLVEVFKITKCNIEYYCYMDSATKLQPASPFNFLFKIKYGLWFEDKNDALMTKLWWTENEF